MKRQSVIAILTGLIFAMVLCYILGFVRNPIEISCDIAGREIKMQNLKEYVDDDLHRYLYRSVSVIPSEVFDMYYEDGFKIHTSSAAFIRDYDQVLGKTVYRCGKFKGIYLNSGTEYYDEMTLAHEMGHYLDTKLGTVSGSKEWQEITAKESRYCYEYDLLNPYYKGAYKNNDERYYDYEHYFECPHEFWAEQFAVYCYRVNGTGELPVEVYWDSEFCPEAQAYIESIVNTL